MFLLADIGGTNIKVARADRGELQTPVIFSTPIDPKAGIALIIETFEKIGGGEKAERIIIGAPGVVDEISGDFLIRAPHLPLWVGVPVVPAFSHMAEQVSLYNDTTLCGMGEARFGAGKGFGRVAYITVSTGINGALIEKGRVSHGKFNPEIGFQIIDLDPLTRLEDVASGTAVARLYNMHPRDVARTEHWAGVERAIACGLYNMTLHYTPDVIVVGGSMSKDLSPKRLSSLLNSFNITYPVIPAVVIGTLGSEAGLWGGLAEAL